MLSDVQPILNLTAKQIACGRNTLIWAVMKSQVAPDYGVPEILLITPPPLRRVSGLMEPFSKAGEKTSNALGSAYENVANSLNGHHLDSSKSKRVGIVDVVHLAPSEHRKLALEVEKVVISIFEKKN